MTGMVTAALMASIRAGSLMRATPPSRRMSAGARPPALAEADGYAGRVPEERRRRQPGPAPRSVHHPAPAEVPGLTAAHQLAGRYRNRREPLPGRHPRRDVGDELHDDVVGTYLYAGPI